MLLSRTTRTSHLSRGRRVGAALCALGVLTGGLALLAPGVSSAAAADQTVTSYAPDVSSTLGRGTMEIEGTGLQDLAYVDFGGADGYVTAVDPDGTRADVRIPAHDEGTVELTGYFYPPVIDTTTSTASSTTASESSTTTTATVTLLDTTTATLATTTTESSSAPASLGGLSPAAVAALIPVVLGDFTYTDDFTVTPDQGPLAGGTNVVIDGPFLEDILNQCPQPADIQLPIFDIEVYFGDELGTDSRLVFGDDGSLEVRTTSPVHVVGLVDVTVVFRGAGCPEPSFPARVAGDVQAAALPPFGEGDLVFTRGDGYEYVEPAVETETVTESATESATETSVVVTTVIFTEEPDFDPTPPSTTDSSTVEPSDTSGVTSSGGVGPTTTTSTGPVLSSTGVSSATVPMILVAVGLLAAGGVVLLISMRRSRQH